MLDQSLPVLCNGICAADGITFVMAGNQAYTDFKRIVVPQLDIFHPRCMTLGVGYTLHERGHIVHTDPSSMKPFQDGQGKISDALGHSLWNKIEDVRMEICSWADFAGAKRILNNLVTAVVEEGLFAPISNQDSPVQLLQKLILYYGRGYVARQSAAKVLLDEGVEAITTSLPSGLVIRVKALLGTISSLKDAHGSAELALELKKVFEEESKPDPMPPTGSKPPSSGGEPQDAGDGAKKKALRDSLNNLTEADIVHSDIGDLAAKSLQKAAQDHPNKIVPIAKPNLGPRKHNQALLREALTLSNVLKRRLLNLLEAQTDVSYKHSEDGDDLDDQRLVDVLFGELDVFLERHQSSIGFDTEIRLILDRSGSMASTIHLASVVTLGIALTLDQVDGINCSATAFPFNSHDVITLCDREGVRGQSDRFDITAAGSTPMASALWQGVLDLYQSPRSRKIVMVITDGDPDTTHQRPTRELAKLAGESGIDMIGIGIGSSANVERFFNQSVKVDSVESLAPALFGVLRNMLV